jgi:broad specificity phosphatase PhoE
VTLYFITHPNVVVSRDVPVPRWPLSELGRKRMRVGLAQPWVREISSIYCSSEQKAIDGARILADHLGLSFTEIEDLGENDRSATGFLPPDEFERVADQFFASPTVSVRGWERAVDAQARIVRAVEGLPGNESAKGPIAIVSHGAVGTLLYCNLASVRIDRRWDQPANGGGNYFRFTLSPRAAHSWWQPVDLVSAS